MLLKPIKYRYVDGVLYKLIRYFYNNKICEFCMLYKTKSCMYFQCGRFDIDLFTYVPVNVIKEVQDT